MRDLFEDGFKTYSQMFLEQPRVIIEQSLTAIVAPETYSTCGSCALRQLSPQLWYAVV